MLWIVDASRPGHTRTLRQKSQHNLGERVPQLPFRVPMLQDSVSVKFCDHAIDALDLVAVPSRAQQFSVALDLLVYFNARLAH